MSASIHAFPVEQAARAPFGARRVWAALSAMIETRRERAMLAEMDGRLLADIGVSRGDAHMEAGRAFWDVGSRR